ncbi:MAG: PLP-dependent aminotransferase family protein [Bacteroides sp.]|nr:PLP-dependent aminotransferase family protein [Eubacterium sp.]MCM1419152.1 PLP-dependent aminotransferase family protein [Roseburia sp.]MCM1463658.1 PLP-dependent aminotransferase family protein [Bacteroides sp.]
MAIKPRKKPAYELLYEALKNDILTGKLKNKEKLPSKRALAEERRVSVVTVENAIDQLRAEGYVTSVERSGTFVRYDGGAFTPAPKALPFPPEEAESEPPASGAAALFPFSVWAKLMRTVILEQGTRLLRPVREGGVYELRAAIAEYLYRRRGLAVSPDRVVIGAGTEDLYTGVIRLLGRERLYAVEDPGYEATERIYLLNGARTVRLPLDEEGLSAAALQKSGASVAHISPAHHFPTGIVMPISRRGELLRWAEAKPGRYIIEDDYDGEFRRAGIPVPAMFGAGGDRVLYIGTFSQTLAPSVRIGYLCLPPHLLQRWRDRLGFCACPVPSFEQYTLAKFISEGYFERHVSRVQKFARRAAELSEALFIASGVRVVESGAGLHFRIAARDAAAPIKRAEECGLRVRPIGGYFRGEPGAAENRVAGYEDQYVVSYANADLARLEESLRER